MLTGMLRFEWRYHTHRITFALVTLVLCFMSFAMVSTQYAARSSLINSPYAIMQSCALLSLWALVTQTVFTVNGALRDHEHGMSELILSRPIGRLRYLFSRFAGILLAGMTVMTIATVVLMLLPMFIIDDPSRVGPVRWAAYALPLLTLVLPNLALVSALLFAVAALTRSTLATYVGSIAIFALYIVASMLVDSPFMAGGAPPTAEALARAAVLDPFGVSAFFEQTRYWTPAERNSELVSLSGRYLTNRLLWTGVAAVVMLLLHRFVAFGATRVGSRSQRTARQAAAATKHIGEITTPKPVAAKETAAAYLTLAADSNQVRAFFAALRSTAIVEMRHVVGAWIFRAFLLLWTFIVSVELWQSLGAGEYNTHLLANSGQLLEDLAPICLMIGSLCVVYFAAEVVWRERAVHFDTLIDATPAANGVFLFAKLLALCAIPLLLTLAGYVIVVVIQLVSKGMPIEPRLFVAHLWFTVYPLLLVAVGALALQVLAPNRWVGLIGGLLLVMCARFGDEIGLEHPMLRYGAAPGVTYSALDGFGPAASSFSAFMGYWTAFAMILLALSLAAWRRGLDVGVWSRVQPIWRAATMAGYQGTRRVMLASAAVFAVAAMLLFRQTNVLHAWESRDANVDWRVEYERTYRHLAGRPQPSVVDIEIKVDFEPAQRLANVRGTQTLRNNSPLPIDTVWITMRRDAVNASVSMESAQQHTVDARYALHRFVLAQRMQPGDSATVHFDLTLDRGGIRADGFDQDVAANGSFLTIFDIAPTFGYRNGLEVSEPSVRRKFGLPEATTELATAVNVDSLTREARRVGQALPWITFRATVSTTDGQVALAPGNRVRSWSEGDRSFALFQSDSLTTAAFALVSARYAVTRERHGSVDLEFWHHPAHAQNVPRMMAAATRTLDVLSPRFGAYRGGTLRMVEVPASWPFGAFAMPGMLAFTENRGMLADPRSEDVDLLTRRVAHEVSHQWWGHTVAPLYAPGATIIVETLAKYSEQLVVADLHGDDALPPMLGFEHDRYLAGRGEDAETEPTLLTAGSQPHIYYGKGALAMHALHNALGEPAMTRALRTLVDREGGPYGAATATTLRDLLRAEATTTESRALVDEWFGARIIYDLRTDTATVTRTDLGYAVRAQFTARRISVRDGKEVDQSPDGTAIDVVVRGAAPNDTSVLYRGVVRVVDGRATLNASVRALPGEVEIDPRIHRIDRDRSNNIRAIGVK